MKTNSETRCDKSTALVVIIAIVALVSLIAFQQSYAKSHNYGIEQPVGWFGIAEYYFRHPFGR
ncbi:hypothetical protein KBI23_04130 [bacterium]|nr:hypothetical protein [bacterium]MBP9807292.1 hypothetical protein [bacterium]